MKFVFVLAFLKMPAVFRDVYSKTFCCLLFPQGIQVWSNAKECFNKMWASLQPMALLHQNESQIVQSETISWSLSREPECCLHVCYAELKRPTMILSPCLSLSVSHICSHWKKVSKSELCCGSTPFISKSLKRSFLLAFCWWSKFPVCCAADSMSKRKILH